jgi:hypothetical protein
LTLNNTAGPAGAQFLNDIVAWLQRERFGRLPSRTVPLNARLWSAVWRPLRVQKALACSRRPLVTYV